MYVPNNNHRLINRRNARKYDVVERPHNQVPQPMEEEEDAKVEEERREFRGGKLSIIPFS